MDILCFKLASGEEVVATSTENPGLGYFLTNALQIFTMPDEATGTMKMGAGPFLPYTDGQIFIPFAMAIVAPPNEDIENMYKQKFGGIILPPKKIIA